MIRVNLCGLFFSRCFLRSSDFRRACAAREPRFDRDTERSKAKHVGAEGLR